MEELPKSGWALRNIILSGLSRLISAGSLHMLQDIKDCDNAEVTASDAERLRIDSAYLDHVLHYSMS
jgi:hypothetical protein